MENKLKCPVCSSEDVEACIETSEESNGLFKFICYNCSANFVEILQATCNHGYCVMFAQHNNKLKISKVMSKEQYDLLVQILKNQVGIIVDISPEEFYKEKLINGNKV